LVDDAESKQSLDYIFECFYHKTAEEDTSKIKILYDTLKIEQMRLNSKELEHLDKSTRMYGQLSDHYGMSCELHYENDGFVGRI
jgi:hypothetical protein